MGEKRISRYMFTHPGNVGIYGKTQSGKTTLIFDLIRNIDNMVRDKNDNLVHYNSIWVFHGVASQSLYEGLQSDEPSINFYRGFPTEPIEDVVTKDQRPALVFIDDQEELLRDSGENRVKNLVNRDCHHLDMLVVMSFQSLFPRGNESLNIQRQFDVYVFMTFTGNNNIRLKLEKVLGERRKLIALLVKVWHKWTKIRGGYMLIDLHLDRTDLHKEVIAWCRIFPADQGDEEYPPRLLKKNLVR